MRNTIFILIAGFLCAGCAAHRPEPISKPLVINSQKLALGEKSYHHHCNKCHPGGEQGLGVAINNKPLPGFMIKAQVRAGAGAMPAFSHQLLNGEDLEAIVEYLKLLRQQRPAES